MLIEYERHRTMAEIHFIVADNRAKAGDPKGADRAWQEGAKAAEKARRIMARNTVERAMQS